MNTAASDALYAREDRAGSGLLGLAERGLVPDPLLRAGIRRLCAKRLADEGAGGLDAVAKRFQKRIDGLKHSEVAIHTDAANGQHYELPPRFFESSVLGLA